MRRSLRRTVLGAAGLALACAVACGERESSTQPLAADIEGEASEAPSDSLDVAVLKVKDFGEIRVELYRHKAPKTVENFEKLAESGFYDETTFHRVIPDFMIQGGDPNTKDRDPRNDGYGGPGYTIPDERNDTKHLRGVVSMANTGRPNSAGSQFFILVKDAPHLDGGYTAFGRVIEGMDVADQIVAVERDLNGRRGPRDRPLENVVIESIRIEQAS